jgi:hypothetical protein
MAIPSTDRWQELVRAAMREQDPLKRRLHWTERDGGLWDLHGDCPHCGHYMSVVVSDVVASDSALESIDLIEVLAVCACEEEQQAGRRGCGAGRDGYVRVRGPQV